jgi:hypothetical protein
MKLWICEVRKKKIVGWKNVGKNVCSLKNNSKEIFWLKKDLKHYMFCKSKF